MDTADLRADADQDNAMQSQYREVKEKKKEYGREKWEMRTMRQGKDRGRGRSEYYHHLE
ncbi:hypothetical protein HPP92_016139 [Vanilla planifolia]|uniref:Uncharacterized protein n=1 Tax=Vanilla planifolia TaxID=51239 RepID=A0A835URT2_VANPL|nr:hypothetical protein HPP92_016139 [Vanilla planifolia]